MEAAGTPAEFGAGDGRQGSDARRPRRAGTMGPVTPQPMTTVPVRSLSERLPIEGTADAVLEAFLDWVADVGLTLYRSQEEALLEVVGGAKVIVATPTGSGKSMVAAGAHFAALAGRAGYDTEGNVVAQAPEHVIDKELALAKAGEDPKKRRKVVRSQPRGSSAGRHTRQRDFGVPAIQGRPARYRDWGSRRGGAMS